LEFCVKIVFIKYNFQIKINTRIIENEKESLTVDGKIKKIPKKWKFQTFDYFQIFTKPLKE